MTILRENFYGDVNIGLYGFATDKYCLLGLRQKINKKIKKALGVPVYVSTFLATDFAGLFAAGNSSGIAVSGMIEGHELQVLKKMFENILVLPTRFTAIGNLILLNDSGIVLSPLLRKNKKEIESFFKLPCAISTIAGISVTGSCAIATNKGCVVHPKIKLDEKKIIEEVLDVSVDISTVSFGSPFAKSGAIANSRGLVISTSSSGPEMGRITEVLGFV
ncbi:MAG: translation initiation factor IF-6 [Candidatus Aenigmarchaeota archaeon]|nr:translation initiation factor IF-6 [Candidatus Aenigmarchaeota archaeon]